MTLRNLPNQNVKLSDGNVGVVTKTHPLYPLRPTIKILKSENDSVSQIRSKIIAALKLDVNDDNNESFTYWYIITFMSNILLIAHVLYSYKIFFSDDMVYSLCE